jgi:hypothetical protein
MKLQPTHLSDTQETKGTCGVCANLLLGISLDPSVTLLAHVSPVSLGGSSSCAACKAIIKENDHIPVSHYSKHSVF